MTEFSLAYGTAFYVHPAPMTKEESEATNARYYSHQGKVYAGEDTTDVSYACGQMCLTDLIREHSSGFDPDESRFVLGIHGQNAVTLDVDVPYQYPDYSVYCASCGVMVNEGGEEE